MDQDQLKCLNAELEAIALWDELYLTLLAPNAIEMDAFEGRQKRRKDISPLLMASASLQQTGEGQPSRGYTYGQFTT